MVEADVAKTERAGWFLLKLFVLFGGSFSLLTGVVGYFTGLAHRLAGAWLLSGAFFGAFMTAILGSMHLIRGRRPGRSGAVRVKQSGVAIVPGPMDSALARVRASLARIRARRIRAVDGETPTLVARMPMTLWSFGEKITIALRVLEDGTVRVDVGSRPMIFATIVDYGKNLENVEAILQGMETNGRGVR